MSEIRKAKGPSLLAGLALAWLAALGPAGPACGPVVAPPDDAGADADGARVDLCARPDAPDFCDAGADADADADASTCAGGKPDGLCLPSEDCLCDDCAATARCLLTCVNDGACLPDTGEDCSCEDCGGKAEGCVPAPVGCNDNGICSPLEDDCTCPDCLGERDCQDCVNNGYCAEYVEGCGCADCAATARCLP